MKCHRNKHISCCFSLKKPTDTGGLPYQLTFVYSQPYMITTNIDVFDGLANGALRKLVHLQRDENDELSHVWIAFPHHRVGEELKKKLQDMSIVVTSIRMPYQ